MEVDGVYSLVLSRIMRSLCVFVCLSVRLFVMQQQQEREGVTQLSFSQLAQVIHIHISHVRLFQIQNIDGAIKGEGLGLGEKAISTFVCG